MVKGECAECGCGSDLWPWVSSSKFYLELGQPPQGLGKGERDSSGIDAMIAALTMGGQVLLSLVILKLWEMGYQEEKGLEVGELPGWNEVEEEPEAVSFSGEQVQD